MAAWAIPGLVRIPFLGDLLFNHNPMVYIAFLMVPGQLVPALQDALGPQDPRRRDRAPGGRQHGHQREPGALPGPDAGGRHGRAGRCLPFPLPGQDVRGRPGGGPGFHRRGAWSTSAAGTRSASWEARCCSVSPRSLQLSIQVGGIKFPYEFAVMLPYVLVILVLSLARKARMLGPSSLGIPYNREMRD